jgi:hypothetical protein
VYADLVDIQQRPPLPWDLRLVAYLYLLGGIAAIVHMVVAATAGRPLLNAAVVFLPVGWGLLRLRRGWRRRAVVITVAVPLLGLAMAGYLYVMSGRAVVKWLGSGQGPVGVIIIGVLLLAVVIWQLRVLSSARTKALFGDA